MSTTEANYCRRNKPTYSSWFARNFKQLKALTQEDYEKAIQEAARTYQGNGCHVREGWLAEQLKTDKEKGRGEIVLNPYERDK